MSDGDSVTDITTQGWGGRILGSLLGALVGIALVTGSVVLLYWNEGRAAAAIAALDQARRQLVEVRPDAVDPRADSKLVHLTGMMQTNASAHDAEFDVGGPGLIRLKRTVEMFQWKEEKSTHTEKSLGGSQTQVTTYTYRKQWSNQAILSDRFRHPAGHDNPPFPVGSMTIDSRDVRLGAYRVDPGVLANVTAFEPLPPGHPPEGYQRVGNRLYRGDDPDHPAIGDVRVSFAGVPGQTTSVIAAQIGGALTPFRAADGYDIALASPGLVPAAQMLQQKKHQEAMLTWALRGVGFVVMLIGFALFAAPLAALAGVVPILGDIVGVGVFLIALTLAVPLTLLTIAIAWIVHRPLLGAGLIVLAIAGAIGLRRLHHPRPAPARG
jgi:Transmembrane protein 43